MDLTTARMTSSLSALVAALAVGCGAQVADVPSNPPVMLGLSRTQVTVGQEIDIVGGNFLNAPNGHTEIRLDGEYHTKAGPSYPVSMQFRPHWEDGNKMVWAQFGPFQVPFSPTGDELGTFDGTVTAINYPADDPKNGIESAPADVSLEVLPSIIIRDFHPLTAQCAAPSEVILGGFPYQVKAEAIGFTPVNFSYVVYGEPGVAAPRIVRKPASGAMGEFGADSDLFFNMPPSDRPFYVGTFAVTALDTDGVQHAIGLSYGVHKAIEYINLRSVDVAEIEDPIPVSGCMPGGDTNGKTVTYQEKQSDTRSRTVGVNWDEQFMEQATSMNGGSTSDTYGVSYGVSQSNTAGWEMSQSSTLGAEIGGNAKFSLFGLVEVGVSPKILEQHDLEPRHLRLEHPGLLGGSQLQPQRHRELGLQPDAGPHRVAGRVGFPHRVVGAEHHHLVPGADPPGRVRGVLPPDHAAGGARRGDRLQPVRHPDGGGRGRPDRLHLVGRPGRGRQLPAIPRVEPAHAAVLPVALRQRAVAGAAPGWSTGAARRGAGSWRGWLIAHRSSQRPRGWFITGAGRLMR